MCGVVVVCVVSWLCVGCCGGVWCVVVGCCLCVCVVCVCVVCVLCVLCVCLIPCGVVSHLFLHVRVVP